MKFVAKWRALVAEMGSRRMAALYLAHSLLGRLSGGRARIVPYGLYAQPVGQAALAALKPDAGTAIRRLQGADARLPAATPRPETVVAQRFAEGSECHWCEVKGGFAGFIWLSTGQHDEDEVRCRYLLPADGAWDFDVYVEPRLRLGRTLARLWGAVDADLAARGMRWSFSRISLFNRSSIRTHERLGAVCVGQALFICCGAWELSRVAGRWRLSRSARPQLRLLSPSRLPDRSAPG